MEKSNSAPVRRLGILSNPRHESFAHAIARGATADAAYVEAGYARNDSNAARLNGHERVIQRVAELKQLVQKMKNRSTHRIVLSREWIIEQLIGVVLDGRALDKPDLAGANRALHLLGLEMGMYIERKEIGRAGEFDGLDIAGKKERIMGIARELGLVAQYQGGAADKIPMPLAIAKPEPEPKPAELYSPHPSFRDR